MDNRLTRILSKSAVIFLSQPYNAMLKVIQEFFKIAGNQTNPPHGY